MNDHDRNPIGDLPLAAPGRGNNADGWMSWQGFPTAPRARQKRETLDRFGRVQSLSCLSLLQQ
jgi:hypothetical protein